MQELLMHLVGFIHGDTSMNQYTWLGSSYSFVEHAYAFLMQIRFVSP